MSCTWQVSGPLVAIAALMAAVGLGGITKALEVLGPCYRYFRLSQAAWAMSAYSDSSVCMWLPLAPGGINLSLLGYGLIITLSSEDHWDSWLFHECTGPSRAGMRQARG